VRVMNCARQFGDEFRRGASRNRLTLGLFIELSAVDELHAEIAGTLAFTDFVKWERCKEIQVGGCFGSRRKRFRCACVALGQDQ